MVLLGTSCMCVQYELRWPHSQVWCSVVFGANAAEMSSAMWFGRVGGGERAVCAVYKKSALEAVHRRLKCAARHCDASLCSETCVLYCSELPQKVGANQIDICMRVAKLAISTARRSASTTVGRAGRRNCTSRRNTPALLRFSFFADSR